MKNNNEFYVVFTEGDQWITKFLKKGFGHIHILAHDDINWVRIDPTRTGLQWNILPQAANVEEDNDKFIQQYPATAIVKVRSGFLQPFFGRPFVCHCLSLAKYITGIRCRSFTPYQFYKRLMKWVSISAFRELETRFNVMDVKVVKEINNGK